jgi:NH3-dependent NAD+ synthetase
LADDSDRFSRTYATIARLLKEQMNWLLAVYMAHEHIHTKKQSSDLTRAHDIVKNMRENRASVDDSDYFSRTYATIARLMKEPMDGLQTHQSAILSQVIIKYVRENPNAHFFFSRRSAIFHTDLAE